MKAAYLILISCVLFNSKLLANNENLLNERKMKKSTIHLVNSYFKIDLIKDKISTLNENVNENSEMQLELFSLDSRLTELKIKARDTVKLFGDASQVLFHVSTYNSKIAFLKLHISKINRILIRERLDTEENQQTIVSILNLINESYYEETK